MLSFFTTQSYVRFSEELKSLESETLLVAGLSFSDCTLGLNKGDKITLSLQNSIAFIIKLNTPTHCHCKDFHIGS